MRIGIDLDGVIYDTEKYFRIYQELYDMYVLKQNTKVDERNISMQKRFEWSDDIMADFYERYVPLILKEANYMPGAMMILKMLKEEGHDLVIITARGTDTESLIPITQKRLEEDGIKDMFEKCHYAVYDKADICKKENIDVMIDDSINNCKKTSENKIKTIYLKDAPSYDMKENEYLKVLYNWGEIYRYLKEMEQ